MHGITLRVAEPFRVWPGAAIHHRENALPSREDPPRRVRPHAEDEDPVARCPWPRWVDDDRAAQLRIVAGSPIDRLAARGAIVVVGARRIEGEANVSRFARGQVDRVRYRRARIGCGPARSQPAQRQALRERIANGERDLRPRRNSYERPGNAGRFPLLGERRHRRSFRAIALGMPVREPRLEAQREDAAAKRAGRHAVVVRDDSVDSRRRWRRALSAGAIALTSSKQSASNECGRNICVSFGGGSAAKQCLSDAFLKSDALSFKPLNHNASDLYACFRYSSRQKRRQHVAAAGHRCQWLLPSWHRGSLPLTGDHLVTYYTSHA